MTEMELVEKSVVTIPDASCKQHFGFLGQRAKGIAIPDECFTCAKMIDCTAFKSESTPVARVVIEETELKVVDEIEESTEEPAVAAEPSDLGTEPVAVIEEVEEPTSEEKFRTISNGLQKIGKELVTEKFGRLLKYRIPKPNFQFGSSKATDEIVVTNSGDTFCVESAGTLYNQWSGTVVLSKKTLESWGSKVKEVELRTKKGKTTVCKVYAIADLQLDVVQVPNKIKEYLHIEDGAHINIKPLQK